MASLTFLHRHLPPQSPPSPPLDPSLHSQQRPSPWDCPIIPKFQLPVAAPSRGCASLSRYAWLRQGLILILFRPPQISCFTLSLKCFSSDSANCPDVGIGPLLQVPHLPRAGPILLTPQFFPLVPSSYRVLRSCKYSFPLARSSSLLSPGVLHVFSDMNILCENVKIPDVSVERDVLHIHLLLRHLVLLHFFFFLITKNPLSSSL